MAIWHIASGGSRVAHWWLSQELGDVCWVCWSEPGWEVDHVRPLWSLTDEERLELRWWLPFNLQLIGSRCHKAKTAREAALRAAWRQGERWARDRVRQGAWPVQGSLL